MTRGHEAPDRETAGGRPHPAVRVLANRGPKARGAAGGRPGRGLDDRQRDMIYDYLRRKDGVLFWTGAEIVDWFRRRR